MSTNKAKTIVRLLSGLTLIVLILAAGAGAIALSAGQQANEGLFTAVDRREAVPTDGPAVVRSRNVLVNFEMLGKPSAPASTVVLNLYDDATFTAVFERTETNYLGSFAWIGRLKGVAHGRAVLVATNGLLMGHVSMPGAVYEVRSVGKGLHVVEELDQAVFPPEMAPIPAGAPSMPAGGSHILVDQCDEITVLVAYSPEARIADGGTAQIEARIATAVVETNDSYINSGLGQRIHLVHTMETSTGDAQNDFDLDLAALQDLTDGIFDNVDTARDFHFADEVALIIENSSSCGLGYVNSTEDWAFVTVHRTCATGYYSFGHELGHNMGALHDWYVDDTENFHHGFVNLGDTWRTIMAYNDWCDCSDEASPCPDRDLRATPDSPYCDRLQYWSNPDVDYSGPGDPMGVSIGSSTACDAWSYTPDPGTCDADNRQRLNNTCSTVANFRSGNNPPVLTVNSDPVTINEGQTATNSGTVTDADGHTVTLTASVGSVVNNGDGTWSWSFDTDDGPAESQMVVISADDGHLGTDQVNFTLNVNNVAPTATFNYPTDVDEGYSFELSLTSPYDPSLADTAAGFDYDFDCGDGYDGWGSGNTTTCQTYDNGTLDVAGKIRDKDGGVTEYEAEVTVLNLPPEVTVDVESQTIQYSDYICTVTFEATDVAADPLTATTTPDPLYDSLSLTSQGCVVSDDSIWHTCTWTLDGTIDEAEGDYLITVTVDDGDSGSASESTTVTVEPEDADIWLDENNPVAVEVDAPGGDSPPFTLTAYVQETTPDEAACGPDPGDMWDAQVEMSLVPVGPGSPVTTLCTQVAVVGTGYDAVLEVACDFDDILVNVYHVQATVTGGYYTSDTVEDVLVVFDPSLGFTTGGGWFYWPGTSDSDAGYPGDRTNFGFTMKYNKKHTRIRGNLLLIRHLADGSIYRVKSNALRGLAIGDFEDDGQTVGWASFAGKCTYLEPGWAEPIGNYRFIVYVEDWNEPGAGFDQFWLEVTDKDVVRDEDMSMDRPAWVNTTTIDGGNIVVPHNPD